MPMRNNELWVKGLFVAALLAAPMVGCSGGGDETEGTPEPTQPAATATQPDATATAAGPTDPPTIDGFPVGQYGVEWWYLYAFDDSANPGIAIIIAYTWDETNVPTESSAKALGDYEGQFIAIAWDAYSHAVAGELPNCIIREDLAATATSSSNLGNLDPDTCEFCQSYANISITYRNHEPYPGQTGDGCTTEMFQGYYGVDDPLDSSAYTTVWGYRDTADDGWPADFADDGPDLDADGYVGSLYEADGPVDSATDFYAGYIVIPEDLNEKLKAGKGPLSNADLAEIVKGVKISERPIVKGSPRSHTSIKAK